MKIYYELNKKIIHEQLNHCFGGFCFPCHQTTVDRQNWSNFIFHVVWCIRNDINRNSFEHTSRIEIIKENRFCSYKYVFTSKWMQNIMNLIRPFLCVYFWNNKTTAFVSLFSLQSGERVWAIFGRCIHMGAQSKQSKYLLTLYAHCYCNYFSWALRRPVS